MIVRYDIRKAIQKEMRIKLYIERLQKLSFREKLYIIIGMIRSNK